MTKLCEECGWAGPRESWPELPATDSDEDSDFSEEESEEEKAKSLTANTPKLQVQLPSQENQASEDKEKGSQSEDATVDSKPRFGCNGSCQTAESQDQAEMSKLADEISRAHLS